MDQFGIANMCSNEMEMHNALEPIQLPKKVQFIRLLRKFMFRILSVGPIPIHLAFIMDGNRRFAKKENLESVVGGHRAGFLALMSLLKYCYELGVKFVTIFAFSIDNFRRKPHLIQNIMDLMLEKIELLLKEENFVNEYGIRVFFLGNLKLLNEPLRIAAEKVMKATANNTKCLLLICVAYTSFDEIIQAIQESCKEKLNKIEPSNSDKLCNGGGESCKDEIKKAYAVKATSQLHNETNQIKLIDIQKHMYMAVGPDPDVLIRTSGETRLSNFLLWQTSYCTLYSPNALWPEIGLWHLVWAVLNFQRNQSYLEKKKKKQL